MKKIILSLLIAASSIGAIDKIAVEVSAGELIDKLTILEIKQERIHDPKKLKNINNELQAIRDTMAAYISPSPQLTHLTQQLKAINEKLWVIEDDIREKEAKQEFDQQFIQLARDVYFVNDERGKVKRAINELLGSRLMEEKQYTRYEKIEA